MLEICMPVAKRQYVESFLERLKVGQARSERNLVVDLASRVGFEHDPLMLPEAVQPRRGFFNELPWFRKFDHSEAMPIDGNETTKQNPALQEVLVLGPLVDWDLQPLLWCCHAIEGMQLSVDRSQGLRIPKPISRNGKL